MREKKNTHQLDDQRQRRREFGPYEYEFVDIWHVGDSVVVGINFACSGAGDRPKAVGSLAELEEEVHTYLTDLRHARKGQVARRQHGPPWFFGFRDLGSSDLHSEELRRRMAQVVERFGEGVRLGTYRRRAETEMTSSEALFVSALQSRIPGVDIWLHETDGMPWLIASVDVLSGIGNTIVEVWRVDFDGTTISGGRSPSCLNGDDGATAAEARIDTTPPSGLPPTTGRPDTLAEAAAVWLKAVSGSSVPHWKRRLYPWKWSRRTS